MATRGEQAAARIVQRLEQLETAFDRWIDTAKLEYHDAWDEMSPEERADFIETMGLSNQKELQLFIISRGEKTRTSLLPRWMLEE